MRVIVIGSRKWPDPVRVGRELTRLYLQHGPFVLVHGACSTGADAAAHHWQEMTGAVLGCVEIPYPAKWYTEAGELDRGAGPRRNAAMVSKGADLVLAFPLPDGKGTQYTMELARAAGIPVQEFSP